MRCGLLAAGEGRTADAGQLTSRVCAETRSGDSELDHSKANTGYVYPSGRTAELPTKRRDFTELFAHAHRLRSQYSTATATAILIHVHESTGNFRLLSGPTQMALHSDVQKIRGCSPTGRVRCALSRGQAAVLELLRAVAGLGLAGTRADPRCVAAARRGAWVRPRHRSGCAPRC